MPTEFQFASNPYAILFFLVPGQIIAFARAQFTTGRTVLMRDAFLGYISWSVSYYVLTLPFIGYINLNSFKEWSHLELMTFLFVAPCILGGLLGLNDRHNCIRRLLAKVGLPTVHAIPTAWDWCFYRQKRCRILVTMKDQTRFAGYFGSSSFASSEPGERDIYIESVYEIGDDNEWKKTKKSSVLLIASEIRSVQIPPLNGNKAGNGE